MTLDSGVPQGIKLLLLVLSPRRRSWTEMIDKVFINESFYFDIQSFIEVPTEVLERGLVV